MTTHCPTCNRPMESACRVDIPRRDAPERQWERNPQLLSDVIADTEATFAPASFSPPTFCADSE
jgi:hypothetical protein